MKTYLAPLHHEAGSAYCVQLLDFPGVFSAVDEEVCLMTNAEALAQAARNDIERRR